MINNILKQYNLDKNSTYLGFTIGFISGSIIIFILSLLFFRFLM